MDSSTFKLVTGGNDKHASDRTSVCEMYIVQANRTYQQELLDLRSQLNTTETERAELETDNDKIETSQRYMRGYPLLYSTILYLTLPYSTLLYSTILSYSTLLYSILTQYTIHCL